MRSLPSPPVSAIRSSPGSSERAPSIMIAVNTLNPDAPDLHLGSARELSEVREQFDVQHCVRLSRFLRPPLLDRIMDRVGEATFDERRHGDIGSEECMQPGTTLALLLLIANDARLF